MCKLNIFDKTSFILVLIGAFNWGLIGLLNFNLVNIISLGYPLVQRIIYVVIFLASLNLISLMFRCNIVNSKNY
ncbi:hypothetical protein SAMN05421842_108128 [Clostridium uliginosum]|uniref:DUF378 domain-containing protein n=1 Tax=Clostridium uliginosum TaxID=119641 RepID=A0A1I1LMF3_9CLOT|nr:DUF378 domain-containing protein [Clostridium uliginosum]SFC74294.1 hypothetical protein SAMN05421842_108128 [Clostridium uliginosum]